MKWLASLFHGRDGIDNRDFIRQVRAQRKAARMNSNNETPLEIEQSRVANQRKTIRSLQHTIEKHETEIVGLRAQLWHLHHLREEERAEKAETDGLR